MDIDRITHPLRLARGSHQPGECAMNVISYINRRRGSLVIGKVLVGAAAAVISVGLAAPAGASPVPQPHTVPNFLSAVRAVGITGTDPAMLGDGYNVCWQLWNQHASGIQVAAGLVRDHPQLTNDEAAHFVLAAYNDLCPVPGAYDSWAYSTG